MAHGKYIRSGYFFVTTCVQMHCIFVIAFVVLILDVLSVGDVN